ncbi:MAG: hypothetical protein QN120_01880 [Armatimonadota bacterium]|nr:hypothetical protein [Armatimonadota bacterium]
MRTVAVILSALVLGLAMGPAGASSPGLARDMAALDRAYIPALALTSQANVLLSVKAMAILVSQWQVFKSKYAGYIVADALWQADLVYVDEQIHKADAIVRTGEHLVDAHETLEGIRLRLLETRRRIGLEYYVDYLTEFHGPMEEIVLAAKDKTPATLIDTDVARIAQTLPEAWRTWLLVVHAPLDNEVFELSAAKLAQRQQALQAGTEILHALDQAVTDNSKEDIIKNAVTLKVNFAKLFMIFGDFDSLK